MSEELHLHNIVILASQYLASLFAIDLRPMQFIQQHRRPRILDTIMRPNLNLKPQRQLRALLETRMLAARELLVGFPQLRIAHQPAWVPQLERGELVADRVPDQDPATDQALDFFSDLLEGPAAGDQGRGKAGVAGPVVDDLGAGRWLHERVQHDGVLVVHDRDTAEGFGGGLSLEHFAVDG